MTGETSRDRGADRQQRQAIALLRAVDVAAAWVFGSRATGTATADSDIDVAILRAPALPLLRRERLARELEAVLGARVDLVDFLTASLPLRSRIVQQGRVLFSDDEPRRVAETVLVQSLWEDVRIGLREMDAGFLRRLAATGLADG